MTLTSNRNNEYLNPLRLLALIIFGSYSLISLAQEVGPTAMGLLESMSIANRELNYDGIFIYRRGPHMETMRLIHQRKGDNEVERLVSLTGTAREVIRNNQSVTCIFAEDKAVMVEKSRSKKFLTSALPQPVESISSHYNFSVIGDGRVAGRDTWIVSIRPNDRFRYGYHLWIDKEYHLLLKSELNNSDSEPLEQIMFASMDVLDTIPDEMLKPSIPDAGFTWYDNAGLEEDTSNTTTAWKTTWMPDGFSMSDIEKQRASDELNEMDHLVYSDGLAVVSIFIEKLRRVNDAMTGATNKGAMNAYALLRDGYQVTAVGEVPQATVQRMALSVSTGR